MDRQTFDPRTGYRRIDLSGAANRRAPDRIGFEGLGVGGAVPRYQLITSHLLTCAYPILGKVEGDRWPRGPQRGSRAISRGPRRHVAMSRFHGNEQMQRGALAGEEQLGPFDVADLPNPGRLSVMRSAGPPRRMQLPKS